MEGERYVVRSATDEIMYAILAMSGQEYVDRYANEVKAEQTRGVTALLRRPPGKGEQRDEPPSPL